MFGDITEVMVMKDPTTRRSRYENRGGLISAAFYSPLLLFLRLAHLLLSSLFYYFSLLLLNSSILFSVAPNYFGFFCFSFFVLLLLLLELLLLGSIFFFFPGCSSHRGFGFVTFADPSSVDKVLTNGPHELDGKKVSPSLIISVSLTFAD